MPTVMNSQLTANLGEPLSRHCQRMLQSIADTIGRDVLVTRRLEHTPGIAFLLLGEPSLSVLTRLRLRAPELNARRSATECDLMLGWVLYRDGFHEVACAPGPGLTPRYGQSLGYDAALKPRYLHAMGYDAALNARYLHAMGYDTADAQDPAPGDCQALLITNQGATMMSGPGPGAIFGPQVA